MHSPVGILFSMICPTVRFHLQLLSRLAFALHNADFRGAVCGIRRKTRFSIKLAVSTQASLPRCKKKRRESPTSMSMLLWSLILLLLSGVGAVVLSRIRKSAGLVGASVRHLHAQLPCHLRFSP